MTRRTFLSFLAAFVLGCGCSSLRQDQATVRDSLLKKTPVGSKYDNVIQAASREGWQPTVEQPDKYALLEGEGGGRSEAGGKWIKGHLGHYQHHHRWGTTDMGYRVDVFAYWCFDASGKMTDVIVHKRYTYGGA